MIGACRDLTDYRRASEWIEATERYCERQSVSGFPGVCRVHRAEVAAVGGAWDRAEQELERATGELGGYNATPPQADGFYAIGDIRRLRGDFEGAEAALREAHARGRTPQPALALIRLAEGKVKAAATAIDAAVAEQHWDRWARARLLPAQVEIAIAAGDVGPARGPRSTSWPRSSPATRRRRSRPAGRSRSGRVLLAEGDAAGRRPRAARGDQGLARGRRAVRGRPGPGAPRPALRALDDDDDADLELRAARDEFQRLGATGRRARPPSARLATPRTGGAARDRCARRSCSPTSSARRTSPRRSATQAWERLLRWHDDMLRRARRARAAARSSTRPATASSSRSSRRAGRSMRAIAIQRALREHRDATGSRSPVRIGLHAADANRRGADYSGMGVHVAARVGALAAGGEILATADTLAEAGERATVSSGPSRSAGSPSRSRSPRLWPGPSLRTRASGPRDRRSRPRRCRAARRAAWSTACGSSR